jgi:hypothetical protein
LNSLAGLNPEQRARSNNYGTGIDFRGAGSAKPNAGALSRLSVENKTVAPQKSCGDLYQ